MPDLNGKTALVTGATSAIGKAATALAARAMDARCSLLDDLPASTKDEGDAQ